MASLIIGIFMVLGVLGFSFQHSNLTQYINAESIVMVIGGTFALAFLTTPSAVLRGIWRSVKGLFQAEADFSGCRAEIERLVTHRALAGPSNNHLIQYAHDLWEQGVDPEVFVVLLSQKKNEMDSRELDAIQALKNLAKYPPALGMTGTVMGMLALFSHLDKNKDSIGAHLSLAMTATLFGLLLTNLILSPLADRLHVRQVGQQRTVESVYEILLLINRGEPASLIREELHGRAA